MMHQDTSMHSLNDVGCAQWTVNLQTTDFSHYRYLNIFTTMVQACKHLSIKSDKPKPVSDMERAAVLLGVIVHQNSNSTPAGTNGEANNNDANKLWNDTVSN